MKLPSFLLRLLPLWSYICPRCRREVPKNSSKCPYCKERYGKPLKVPPLCLKNKEALEKYVHEKVFPRISARQREYLAQYFTTIFEDGFESGDFSAWSGIVGTPTVTSDDQHHGTYSCYINGQEGAYKNLGSSYSELYMRVYFKMTSYPNADYYRLGIIKIGQAGTYWGFALHAEAYQDPSDHKTYFSLFNGYSGSRVNAFEVNLNQWYCVELKFSTLSNCILYINGTEAASLGSYPLTADRVAVGSGSGGAYLAAGYIDCVVVADTYIGPETGVTEITVTDFAVGLEALSRSYRGLSAVDVSTGQELFSRLRSLKVLDVVTCLEMLRRAKELAGITDEAQGLEQILKSHLTSLSEEAAGYESLARPTRITVVVENARSQEVLSKLRELAAMTDSTMGIEYVAAGSTSEQAKTKIFLLIGELAIQITGD